MASTLSVLKDETAKLHPGSTAEQVQEVLNIGLRFLTDVLSMRGQTIDEWRAFRKQVVTSELEFIDQELANLNNPTPS